MGRRPPSGDVGQGVGTRGRSILHRRRLCVVALYGGTRRGRPTARTPRRGARWRAFTTGFALHADGVFAAARCLAHGQVFSLRPQERRPGRGRGSRCPRSEASVGRTAARRPDPCGHTLRWAFQRCRGQSPRSQSRGPIARHAGSLPSGGVDAESGGRGRVPRDGHAGRRLRRVRKPPSTLDGGEATNRASV